MLGLKKQLSVKSIIGPGMRVDGPVVFQDGLQIDGTVLGDVKAEADQPSLLVITETGSVHGAICADQVVIGGTVVGPVQAGERLELQAKAKVEGDVQYKSLEMQQGAIIAGELRPQLTPRPPSSSSSDLREPMFLDPDPLAPAKHDSRPF